MESIVISAALLFVMLLLFVVVYDNNATLRGFLGRRSRVGHRRKKDNSLAPQEEEKETSEAPIFDTLEESTPSTQRGNMQVLESQTDVTAETPKAKSGGVFRRFRGTRQSGKKSHEEQVSAMMTSLDALRSEMEQLSDRVTQAEQASDKIDQLEQALAKVAEDTQTFSEDFKDVLGSLRASIDGLESQLAQICADQPATGESEATPDQDTLERIGRLEDALETFNAAISVFPQELQGVQENIGQISSRVETITTDLHRTLGYAIQKEFKCASCGSEGLVASQVICSKCGTGSMWGWWPGNQDTTESETSITDSGIDATGSGE